MKNWPSRVIKEHRLIRKNPRYDTAREKLHIYPLPHMILVTSAGIKFPVAYVLSYGLRLTYKQAPHSHLKRSRSLPPVIQVIVGAIFQQFPKSLYSYGRYFKIFL